MQEPFGATGNLADNESVIRAQRCEADIETFPDGANQCQRTVGESTCSVLARRSVFDIVSLILSSLGEVSVSKIQLLLYYCQAWSLVWDDEKAFDEPILAGPNGPFVKQVQEVLRGTYAVRNFTLGTHERVSPDICETCSVVIGHYGKMQTQDLVFLAQSEDPWKTTRQPCDNRLDLAPEIHLDVMLDFYRSMLSRNGEEQKS